MTSSIFDDRTVRGPWAPSTQATASTTLDFPLPLGPTTTVTPGSNCSVEGSANDLKPFRVSDFRNTGGHPTCRTERDADAGSHRKWNNGNGTSGHHGRGAITGCHRPLGHGPGLGQIWQCSHRKAERPLTFTRTIEFRQRRQALPSRS